jgi:pilus assembly protein Flp/PilA
MMKLKYKLLQLLANEEGQDMVEYALVVALLVFGSAAGMHSVAAGISGEFSRVSSTLVSYVA